MWFEQGGVMHRDGVWSKATTLSCYGHTSALPFQPLSIYMSCAIV